MSNIFAQKMDKLKNEEKYKKGKKTFYKKIYIF